MTFVLLATVTSMKTSLHQYQKTWFNTINNNQHFFQVTLTLFIKMNTFIVFCDFIRCVLESRRLTEIESVSVSWPRAVRVVTLVKIGSSQVSLNYQGFQAYSKRNPLKMNIQPFVSLESSLSVLTQYYWCRGISGMLSGYKEITLLPHVSPSVLHQHSSQMSCSFSHSL